MQGDGTRQSVLTLRQMPLGLSQTFRPPSSMRENVQVTQISIEPLPDALPGVHPVAFYPRSSLLPGTVFNAWKNFHLIELCILCNSIFFNIIPIGIQYQILICNRISNHLPITCIWVSWTMNFVRRNEYSYIDIRGDAWPESGDPPHRWFADIGLRDWIRSCKQPSQFFVSLQRRPPVMGFFYTIGWKCFFL